MASKKAVLILGFLTFAAVAAGLYMVAEPVLMSHQYIDKIHALARPLEGNFRDLDKSTELPLVTDPRAREETKKSNAAHISQLITAARQKLAALKTTSNSLAPLPYSNVFDQYESALVLHDHADRFVGQAEDALDSYQALAAYLTTFNAAADDVLAELGSFNKVTNLNDYSGQSETMRQVAVRLRADAALLSRAARQSDTAALTDAAVAAFDEAANGFDDLAYGLLIPADDPIYAAARRIEGATGEVERVTGTMYDDSISQSRTIKDIQDLNEKLELVLEK